uniref:Uncharacterized protein n=1 Tax=Schizaphis graminum TaxID=13262 RepID=A0A2S2N7N4_SCHGA
MNKNLFYYLYCCVIIGSINDNDVQTFTKNNENEVTSKQFSNENVTRTKKEKQHHKINKLNFTSEISFRMERLENQKKNDEEMHGLLKQEILLKIENERELLKKRKIETEISENELNFQ